MVGLAEGELITQLIFQIIMGKVGRAEYEPAPWLIKINQIPISKGKKLIAPKNDLFSNILKNWSLPRR